MPQEFLRRRSFCFRRGIPSGTHHRRLSTVASSSRNSPRFSRYARQHWLHALEVEELPDCLEGATLKRPQRWRPNAYPWSGRRLPPMDLAYIFRCCRIQQRLERVIFFTTLRWCFEWCSTGDRLHRQRKCIPHGLLSRRWYLPKVVDFREVVQQSTRAETDSFCTASRVCSERRRKSFWCPSRPIQHCEVPFLALVS